MTTQNHQFTPTTPGKLNRYRVEQKKIITDEASIAEIIKLIFYYLMNKKTADRQVSKLIPKGEGYNIANRLPTAKKFGDESTPKKFAMIKCNCCTRMVPGVIVTLGGIRDEIPLHMPCLSCGRWLGHLEEDHGDVLEKMCLDCFKEETS